MLQSRKRGKKIGSCISITKRRLQVLEETTFFLKLLIKKVIVYNIPLYKEAAILGRFLMGQAYHGPRYPLIEIETIGTIKWANQSVLALATTWSLYPDYWFSDHSVFSDLNPSDGDWSQNPMETQT